MTQNSTTEPETDAPPRPPRAPRTRVVWRLGLLILAAAVLAYGLVTMRDGRDAERAANRRLASARRELAAGKDVRRRAEADLAAARAAITDFSGSAQFATAAGAALVDVEAQLTDRLNRLRAAGAAEDIGAYNQIVDELNGSNDAVGAAVDALELPFRNFSQSLGRLPTARCAGRLTTPITWASYGTSGLKCARLAVPLDYERQRGPSIELTIVRRPADNPIGALPLVLNPGGPGGSSIAFLREAVLLLPNDVLQKFDLIGVDPRGVGQSTPVDCADNLDPLFDIDLTAKDLNARSTQLDVIERIIKQCKVRSGALLRHLDTQTAARDLDRVRAALQVNQISYLGFSYGTYLGAVYADRFPERLRAAVLDGAVDPKYAVSTVTFDTGTGFNDLLNGALLDCGANPRCPFHGTGDTGGRYDALMTKLQTAPLSVGPRRLGRGLAELGVVTALYSGSDGWGDLMDALAKANAGDGAPLLALSDSYTGRRRDGSYSNETEAHYAIACTEVRSRPSHDDARAKVRAISTSPKRFETVNVMLSIPCAFWPAPPNRNRAGTLRAKGAAPILVVGTEGDPVTPIEDAEALTKALDSGHLLRWQGDGHTAFGRGVDCIDNAVSAYLVNLTVPAEGTSCPAE